MDIEATYPIAMPAAELWPILMDVHEVAACLEGVEELDVVEEDRYRGRLGVKMGPVRLRFEGDVEVTSRDHDNRVGMLEASAKDAKAGGGFKATLEMRLSEIDPTNSKLAIRLETTFLGRIGQLGRPLIKKKISTMMNDFINTLQQKHGVA